MFAKRTNHKQSLDVRGSHFLFPIPTGVASDLPDALRKKLSSEQIKTLESEADAARKKDAADLDPWFGTAEADEGTIASTADLE